jgi:MoxR-like ATPase
LCGYKTITGTEISGVFNQAVGKPCIIVLEEIDLLNNKIQNQLNSLLEERVINIQEQPIALHEDTIIVGTANTDGMNYSDTYMTRQQSDQSLLSRFVRIKYDIDPAIEF